MRPTGILSLALPVALLVGLSAASADAETQLSSPTKPTAIAVASTRVLQGVVTSGGTRDVLPLAGATVQVYAAGASGATVVGKATTKASGAFSVSVPSGQLPSTSWRGRVRIGLS